MIPFSIPFYQTQWSGIDLLRIRDEIGQSPNSLPSSAFYERYYRILEEQKILFSPSWIESKKGQSDFLRSIIDRYGGKHSRTLSIGAGTGIVEKPLIEQGYPIELQDFQGESFTRLNMHNLTRCYTSPLDQIPHQYDICFSLAVSYALDEETLSKMLRDIEGLLRPNGIYIWIDAGLSWPETYSYLRNRIRLRNNAVLWGHKRNILSWKKFSKRFHVIEEGYYDQMMRPFSCTSILGMPAKKIPSWQMLVLRKPA